MSELPRVTQILAAVGLGPNLSMVPEDVLEAALDRGRAVHAAIELLCYGSDLDDLELDSATRPYVQAFKKFMAESGYKPEYAEIEVRNKTWGYRGHPDSIGWILGKRVLLDVKSGGAQRVEYQVSGYKAAWDDEHPTEPIDSIASLQLRRDGSYRFSEYIHAEVVPVFYAAVTVFRARGDQ